MSHRRPALIFLLVLIAIQAPLKGDAALTDNSGLNLAIEIEDTSFRPDPDGFSFPNYGNVLGIVGLTPIEMQRMFGDKVIASTVGGNIILTPQAKRWMNLANKAMAHGHCEGMAVLSDLIYYNKTDPKVFGGRTTINLSIENELLQREIAYWWSTQATHPGGSQKVRESPNAVLNTLAQAFKNGQKASEWWVMGLYQPDRSGGHAVTPFALENLTNGTTKIWIYDSNYPTKTRYIEIDRNANTWTYNGSIETNEPMVFYAGNASTASLEVVSVSSRLGPQICEFCIDGAIPKGVLSGQKHTQIWTIGIDRVLITDEFGRRIGFTDSGKYVNEIPGAERLDLRLSDSEDLLSKKFLVYDLLDGLNFSIKFISSQERKCTEIFNNWNKNSVSNSPLSRPSFSITKPHYICTIETYHWNHGSGTLVGGAISLRKDDGTIIGIWTAEPKSNSDGVPNSLWIAHPNIIIPPGNYTILDTDMDTWSQNSGSNHCGFSKVEGYPFEIELWIIGPGYDIGMQNPGSQGLAELTWTGEDIAKLTFNNAMSGNLILGMGNTEFEVQNAPKIGIIEMNDKRDILTVTNNQRGRPIQVHLGMDVINESGEHRIEDNVSMKPNDIIYFPDPCKGMSCNRGQHCDNGTCVDNPDPCKNVKCAEDQYCENGYCYSNYAEPSAGGASTNTPSSPPSPTPIPPPIDPCAGVSCGYCQACSGGSCVWICGW